MFSYMAQPTHRRKAMLMLCLDSVPVGCIWKLTLAAVSQVRQDCSARALAPAEAVMDLCSPAAEEVAAELAAEQLVVVAATVAKCFLRWS